jgi:hypothetical protein
MRPTSGDPWAPYVPDEGMPWNLRRVVHLHRRAGFAATWEELQRDLKDGPEASSNRLLEGKSRSCGIPADFAAFADRLADRALAAPDSSRLTAWWVYRMLFGPDPLLGAERTRIAMAAVPWVADAAFSPKSLLTRRFGSLGNAWTR